MLFKSLRWTSLTSSALRGSLLLPLWKTGWLRQGQQGLRGVLAFISIACVKHVHLNMLYCTSLSQLVNWKAQGSLRSPSWHVKMTWVFGSKLPFSQDISLSLTVLYESCSWLHRLNRMLPYQDLPVAGKWAFLFFSPLTVSWQEPLYDVTVSTLALTWEKGPWLDFKGLALKTTNSGWVVLKRYFARRTQCLSSVPPPLLSSLCRRQATLLKESKHRCLCTPLIWALRVRKADLKVQD